MVVLTSSLYPRILVYFNFNSTSTLEIPITLDFPTLLVQNESSNYKKAGKLILEEKNLNAEFLLDFLQEEGFFLQKGICQIYENSKKAHSAVIFQFGDEKKRVRKVPVIREVMTGLLSETVWNIRIYEISTQSDTSLVIDLSDWRPYFSLAGELLDNKPDFILQKQNNLLVVQKLKQNSAA